MDTAAIALSFIVGYGLGMGTSFAIFVVWIYRSSY